MGIRRWRKQRDWAVLAADPQTPYMVGRLLGANEMAISLLSREQNDTARHVSEVLDGIVEFFMVELTPTEVTDVTQVKQPSLARGS